MITSKQVKAEDPRLRNLLYVYVVVSRAVCKKVFSSHSEVFSLDRGGVGPPPLNKLG